MNKETGGPIFPCQIPTGEIHKNDQPAPTKKHYGINLRDYFAAKAMQGMLSSGNLPKTISDADIAECVYNLADAMLKARNQ